MHSIMNLAGMIHALDVMPKRNAESRSSCKYMKQYRSKQGIKSARFVETIHCFYLFIKLYAQTLYQSTLLM